MAKKTSKTTGKTGTKKTSVARSPRVGAASGGKKTGKKKGSWLLYGANSYTGELLLEEAARMGLRPILAGRREETLIPLAEKYSLPYRAFSLDDPEVIAQNIQDCELVLNYAGPFINTAYPMVQACLRTKTDYMDITGEPAIFEMCWSSNEQARRAGIMIMPGVGIDIIPTDCIAGLLHAKMPDIQDIKVGFSDFTMDRISKGTLNSILHIMAEGYKTRQNGILKRKSPLSKEIRVDMEGKGKPIRMVLSPLADPLTTFISRGIPNIEFYGEMFKLPINMSFLGPVCGFLEGKYRTVRALQKVVTWVFPDRRKQDAREGFHYIWGQATNARGERLDKRVRVPRGYYWTGLASLAAVKKRLAGKRVPGYQTPSMVFGSSFLMEIPEVEDLGFREFDS